MKGLKALCPHLLTGPAPSSHTRVMHMPTPPPPALWILALVLTGSVSLGCASAGIGSRSMEWTGERETVRVVEAGSRRVLTPLEAIDDLAAQRVIYVAEHHGSPAHHAVQRLVVEGLVSRGLRPLLAVEWVERSRQAVLDRWIRGETTLAQLKEGLAWEERWGHAFEEVQPLFELARVHSLEILALNAPRELVRRVAKVGREGLTDEERAVCPPLTTGNRAHRAHLQAHYAHHPHGQAKGFERFYQAQLVWDERMAEGVSDALRSTRPVVVLAGAGHIAHGFGIPERVRGEGSERFRIVIAVPRGGMADQSTHLGYLAYPSRRGDLFWESVYLEAHAVSH